ncbi:MAG: hypothetical protein ACFFD8_10400 [Candidatus Thorarchaeota archaeon]
MDTQNSSEKNVEISTSDLIQGQLNWRKRLRYLYPVIFSMLFSLFITYIVLLANPLLYPGLFPPITNLFESLIILLVVGTVGGAATFITYIVFQRGSETLHRILIAAFISPLFFILTVFIGQAIFLLLLFQGLNNLHLSLLALASIMFSAFAIVFIFSDAIGITGRNVLFAGYGIILGVFLAVNFTWLISLAILIILAIQDTFFAMRLGPTIVEADPKQHARSAFTFVVGPLVIGVGDLIVYASLVAYALRYFGWLLVAFTLIAIIIGCLINTQIVTKYPNQAIPGLPIPLICSLIPIGIGLAMVLFL